MHRSKESLFAVYCLRDLCKICPLLVLLDLDTATPFGANDLDLVPVVCSKVHGSAIDEFCLLSAGTRVDTHIVCNPAAHEALFCLGGPMHDGKVLLGQFGALVLAYM